MDTLENFLRICRAADYFDSKAIRVESQDDNADSADSNAAHQPTKNSSQVATDFRKGEKAMNRDMAIDRTDEILYEADELRSWLKNSQHIRWLIGGKDNNRTKV
jgi:hypothetical protein